MTFNLLDIDVTGDYKYLLSTLGQDVLINDNPIRALITNTNLSKGYNDKKISSLSPLQRGDLVLYEGKQFMIISEQTGERYIKHKAIMRLLPLTIKVNHNCNFVDVPCFIDSPSFEVFDGKFMSMAAGEINVHTQDNEQTRQIAINDRFIKFGQAFKVTGVDPLSEPGIIILTCKKDQINPAIDDTQNDLAGFFACNQPEPEPEPKDLYIVIKSTSDKPNEIIIDRQKTYSADVFLEDSLVDGESVSWQLFADDKINPTTLASIIEQTDKQCTVKNNGVTNGYVQLRAVLDSDETVESWIRIRMRPLF
ncbi:hypothetical protein [Paenibacillus sp. MSJ-34]|uniref:hypothetical protein n=1 Tax=Paenibacillus sp. MSJ-34 TaxID=2841529 RepID=UPI001C11BF31|nr:hypothetical protein [Paenibacillus sp. MSJ-34]MBU5441731.1 hypothetical protein [Paenibacillus sp. MSJ-34]